MKLFRTICVVGIALCLATSVYAGTQSVKISGDLTIRSLFRNDYDLDKNHIEYAARYTPLPSGGPSAAPVNDQLLDYPGTNDWQNYFMTTTEVQIDADLTDNVSAVIRLVNQRDWNVRNNWGNQAGISANESFAQLEASGLLNDDQMSIGVDLAYIELKEFLYSPLTLRVGRQDIWIGKGFIVGKNQQTPYNSINAKEYTAFNAFDAVRATLDYDPWTVDAIAAKIGEGSIGSEDDETLVGVNVGYIFDAYNGEGEAYWFWKNDANTVQPTRIGEHNTVHTLGLRGSADPVEKWTVAAEAAIQVGDYVGYVQQFNDRSRFAYALDVAVECRYWTDLFAWKPVLGLEYILYSGDEAVDPTRHTDSTYDGWDSMYRGKFDSKIREFFGQYYWSAQAINTMNSAADPNNPEDSSTNQHQLILAAVLQPSDSLTLDARYLAFWNAEKRSYITVGGDAGERKRYVGSEIDVELTWDYTEDVSFGLLTAWFLPGDVYAEDSDSIATDLVGAVNLSF